MVCFGCRMAACRCEDGWLQSTNTTSASLACASIRGTQYFCAALCITSAVVAAATAHGYMGQVQVLHKSAVVNIIGVPHISYTAALTRNAMHAPLCMCSLGTLAITLPRLYAVMCCPDALLPAIVLFKQFRASPAPSTSSASPHKQA